MNTSPKVGKLPISKNLSVKNVDTNEVWKDISGYERYYQASNLGRIKSLERKVKKPHGFRTVNERILIPNLNTHGYYTVSLSKFNKSRTITVHKLIAITFLEYDPQDIYQQIDHINHVQTNNRLSNLRVVTPRENASNKKGKKTGKYLSIYTGVTYHKKSSAWVSVIRINGKPKHLGRFKTELQAHKAYRKALYDLDK